MPDFADWDEYEAWLRTRQQHVVIAMAVRSALRALPFQFGPTGPQNIWLATQTCRQLLTAGVAALEPLREARNPDFYARCADLCAALSTKAAGDNGDAPAVGSGLAARCAADCAALSPMQSALGGHHAAVSSHRSVLVPSLSAISADSEQSVEPRELIETRLWLTSPFDTFDADAVWRVAGSDPVWTFRAEWYDGFLNGAPLDWELQRRIALIPDEDWDAGPERVAERIEEIKALWEVRKRADDLRTEIKVASRDRFGIGGNQPPESLEDDIFVNPAFEIIWAPLNIIEEEIEKDEPDRERVSGALAALKDCIKWCGRKIDLTVDTAIKWGVPVAGASALGALNPEKVAALIDAVQKWLPFL